MTRLRQVFLYILIFLFSAIARPVLAQQPRLYKITGEVFYVKKKKPLSDVFITLYEISRDSSNQIIQYKATDPSFTTTTFKDGKFTFTLDGNKEYLMNLIKEGYVSTPKEITFKKRNIARGEHINIKVGMNKASSLILKGTILDKETQQPIENAKIILTEDGQRETEKVIFSKADGKYFFSLTPKHTYRLNVIAEGYFMKNALISTHESLNSLIEKDMLLENVSKGVTTTLHSFFFNVNSTKIIEKKAKELFKVIKILEENPNIRIEIGCHTDARGDDIYNLKLSQKRADTIATFLQEKGIDASRLTPKGYGESVIINECKNNVKCSTVKHEENRRVTIKII